MHVEWPWERTPGCFDARQKPSINAEPHCAHLAPLRFVVACCAGSYYLDRTTGTEMSTRDEQPTAASKSECTHMLHTLVLFGFGWLCALTRGV